MRRPSLALAAAVALQLYCFACALSHSRTSLASFESQVRRQQQHSAFFQNIQNVASY